MDGFWDDIERYYAFTEEERDFLRSRQAKTELGLAALLKYFQLHGHFPEHMHDIPVHIWQLLSSTLEITLPLKAVLNISARTFERYRARIREFLGFRPAHQADEKQVHEYLCQWIQQSDCFDENAITVELLSWYQSQHIEPPATSRQTRVVRSAMREAEKQIYCIIAQRLPNTAMQAISTLIAKDSLEERAASFNDLKDDTGGISLARIEKELSKLSAINSLSMPENLLDNVPETFITSHYLRIATESVWYVREYSEQQRYAMMAIYCTIRKKEIIDNLVNTLIHIIHKLKVSAERRVTKRLVKDFKLIRGKNALLARIAEIALKHPELTMEEALYTTIGKEKLAALVQEYRRSGPAFKHDVQMIIHSSYKAHYRKMLPPILEALRFRSNNQHYRPIIEALEYLSAISASKKRYLAIDDLPLKGVVPKDMRPLVIETLTDGSKILHRIHYEICVLQALRDRLRCKEIWVEGAKEFCNPDDDLPQNFEEKREDYYQQLGQPLDAQAFIASLKDKLTVELEQFNQSLPKNKHVTLRHTGKKNICLSPLKAQDDPPNLHLIKNEVSDRWDQTNLLDILKETALRTGFTENFKGLGNREILSRDVIQRRLLLCLFGLGTNTGLKRVLSAEQDITYDELDHIKARYIHKEALRAAIADVVNATFDIRQPHIWGHATNACASDATKISAYGQNLMTEWHIRYNGRGIMIYWHVDKKANCIYSQLKRCSASEVASMIEGVLHHCTDMEVEKQYVDTHGQSTVAFAFCHILGFQLMPRLKNIATQKLYLPEKGMADAYPNLQPILTKPINWEIIRQQYDEIIKFSIALKNKTATPEVILRRFTRNNLKHPTYKALAELGKVKKTIFLCQYLSSESTRREIQEGLNVIENWNSANSFIFYGKNSEFTSNRTKEQELSMLSMHLLQSSLVYVNTLLLQQVLSEKKWHDKMHKEDFRALTPLIYSHVNPYGIFELDMGDRMSIAA